MATKIDKDKILAWVKENQSLTISIAVSVVLFCGALYFLLHGMSSNQEMTERLSSVKTQLDALQSKNPFPNQANIKVMQEEGVRLQGILDDFEKRFAPIPVPPETYTPSGFKYQLETVVATLTQKAKDMAIQLPTNRVNFSFSFTAQRSNLRMDTNSLKIQAEQLAHVQYLCNLVMDSGISEFSRIRRAAGATNDINQVANYMADYLPVRKIITNKFSFVYPYELVFKTSPTDLANFINSLEESSYGVMIKTIKVERASSAEDDELAGYQETFNPVNNRYRGMMGNRMMGGRMGRMMIPTQQPQEQQKSAAEEELEKALPKVTTTVLKPSAIRVMMFIDFVRLKTDEEMVNAPAAIDTNSDNYFDLDGDGTMDVDANNNVLPTASVDASGNPIKKDGTDAKTEDEE